MPELPDPKPRPHPRMHDNTIANAEPVFLQSKIHNPKSTLPPYVDLHVTSNFTFLTGGSHPDELVQRAAELGHAAASITDVNSLAGIVRAHIAAKECGLPLVVGCRLVLEGHRDTGTKGQSDGAIDVPSSSTLCPSVPVSLCPFSVLVFPTTRAAYGRLCRMLTLGKRRTVKGECHLTVHDLIEHQDGLLAVAIPPAMLDQHCLEMLEGLKRHFNDDRLSLAASLTFDHASSRERLRQVAMLAAHAGIPLVATNDVHYHVPERRTLQDVLTCIKHGCTISQAGFRLFANAERHLKSSEVMAKMFADYPEAIARTAEIANRAKDFSLDQLKYQYPDEVVPPGHTAMQHLIDLTWQGAAGRYPGGIPPKVRVQIEHEFTLIDELNYAPYFLTVHDLVVYARSRGILCQGRGAAANSAVCYCLGVTAVDPDRIDLLFERFISKERNEPPDIDIDFEHERREEVIQYIYAKYGRDRAALTAEVISYRGRSAVREVGKALGLSLDCVDRLAKSTEWWSHGVADPERLREMGLNPTDPTIHQLSALANEILGFPRHLSQHVGGFVITHGPLCESVPIENAAMPDRTVIEWDKDDIDALGMLKVDVLGLGMLTCIGKAFGFLNESDGATERRSDEEPDIGHSGVSVSSFSLSPPSLHRPVASSLISHTSLSENTHGLGQNLPRLDCMAEEHGVSQSSLCGNSEDARYRAVRSHESNEASGSLDSIQYCRGSWTSEPSRLPQALADCARIIGRTGDAIRAGGDYEHDFIPSTNQRIAGGSGSDSPRPDPQPRSQERELTQFLPRHNLVLASLYELAESDGETKRRSDEERTGNEKIIATRWNPPSLRRSVASSLKPPHPPSLELHTIPPEDPLVYDMICHADTIGVFQIESRAQMSMLPRLRPRCFYDLVIEVAIVRPGPIQGDMVHPYLRRRNGQEKIEYPNEAVERVLKKTLGVPLFQEQAMSLAIVAAGFTPGEADQLRRAIAAWKSRPNQIHEFGERLVQGMIERGYDHAFAERCFRQIQGFSGYGFPESHAASFAHLVYVSAWLKCHYPGEFAAALINSQPMGFYAPAQIVRDAQDHGVEVRPIDVNCSEWDCTMEETENRQREKGQRDRGTEGQREGSDFNHSVPLSLGPSVSALNHSVPLSLGPSVPFRPPLRLGMRLVRGLSQADADAISGAVKRHGPFTDIRSLWRASGVRVNVLRRLARADAFTSMGLDRQHALWQVRALKDERLPIFETEVQRDNGTKGQQEGSDFNHSVPLSLSPLVPFVHLPPVPDLRKVAHDYHAMGLSLRSHPISHIRGNLSMHGVTPNIELKDPAKWPQNRTIAVAGLVLVRQRPSTANGIVFMTLEDETGIANLIVRPDVYKRCRKTARHGVVVLARGKVERQGEVVHVLIHHLEDVSLGSETPTVASRDFH